MNAKFKMLFHSDLKFNSMRFSALFQQSRGKGMYFNEIADYVCNKYPRHWSPFSMRFNAPYLGARNKSMAFN